MTSILLIAQEERWRKHISGLLPDASLFVAIDEVDALRQLRRVSFDLLFWAAERRGDIEAFISQLRNKAPDSVIVAVSNTHGDADFADYVVTGSESSGEFIAVVRRAVEQNRRLRELSMLRSRLMEAPSRRISDLRAEDSRSSQTALPREFTRILTAGFDLERSIEAFLDAVGGFLRPARLALLVPDSNTLIYRIRAHRGFSPQVAEAVQLNGDRGLCYWLSVEGRPARSGDIANDEVAHELALLQATMAIPLLARGELLAVLVVGPPVVHSAYATHEIETLFDVATHLAAAIDGINLHNRLQRANEFNERILEHMSSGVVTIGADEKVSIANRRAGQILQLDPKTVVGQDLRALPSPLGDMLYETLTTGRAKPRAEIRLALRGLWLEVSTYPVSGDDAKGAVLVLEDLTAQKELAAQKLQAQQLELLARVVARIADEIKNPLVSINTFTELLGERFDDPEFRRHFTDVVGRDVRRLVQVFEKLAGLVHGDELNFSTVDLHSVVDEAVAAVQPLEVHVTREPSPVRVKVDPAQLRKALAYLVLYLGHHSPERAAVALGIGRHAEADGAEDVQVVIGSRTAVVPQRELDGLFDPVRMVQENVIDIGPAVSQRIVEALGGSLELRQSRRDLSFVMRLPGAV
jgi:nitrogen-specific signal transduction histidine kinase